MGGGLTADWLSADCGMGGREACGNQMDHLDNGVCTPKRDLSSIDFTT